MNILKKILPLIVMVIYLTAITLLLFMLGNYLINAAYTMSGVVQGVTMNAEYKGLDGDTREITNNPRGDSITREVAEKFEQQEITEGK